MLDSGEAARWFSAARRTLASARGDLERGDYNWACFKAQQAAELALKGVLAGLGEPRFGHSVLRLLGELAGVLGLDPGEDLVECAAYLDKLYIPTRYPDAWAEGEPGEYYTRGDAVKALSCAERILGLAEGLAGGGGREGAEA